MEGLGLMDDVKALNLLVQTGSFGVLILLALWVTRFIIKRIEKSDQVREAEAESKRDFAQAFREAAAAQEKAQSERVEKLIDSHNKAITGLKQTSNDHLEKILKAHSEQLTRERELHAEQLRYEREICDKRHVEMQQALDELHKEMAATSKRNYDILRDISHGVRDVQQTRANERAVKKQQEQTNPPGSK
jgi:F0F1-type ATP synthase membrane subunit b/b'